jgi:cupin 2 domain-containing protein
MTVLGNLFRGGEPPESGERFEELLKRGTLSVRRILSSTSPDTSEYDQPEDEWVALLSGEAELEVNGASVSLLAGDYLFLEAHTKHRVLRTSRGATWLAIHIGA